MIKSTTFRVAKTILAACFIFTVLSVNPTCNALARDGGARIDNHDNVIVWWCSATHKIRIHETAPSATADSAPFIYAARHEYEPFQCVIQPQKPLRNFRISISDLFSGPGQKISRKLFSINQVTYVQVTAPSDNAGETGIWPDPLPPFNRPIDLAPNRNYSLRTGFIHSLGNVTGGY